MKPFSRLNVDASVHRPDVLPNGDVSPCFELVCGNARTQPFAEIWNSEPFRAHRRRLAQHGPYPVCARCCAYFRQD